MLVERLNAEDFDELLQFLDHAFGHTGENSFLHQLPAMWERNDAQMGKHLAIRVDGKICAALGIYPLRVTIAGHSLLFATCGNIGVLPEYRNKGYMQMLLEAAMVEMDKMGVDVARLGGQRQRYERFGFEKIGTLLTYNLTQKNIGKGRNRDRLRANITFREINKTDAEALQFASNLQQSAAMSVDRGDPSHFYNVMRAWRHVPYIAELTDGTPIGVLSASADGHEIAEQYALNAELKYSMLAAWLTVNKFDYVTLFSAPWDIEFNRIIEADCESVTISGATQCKVMRWENLINALLDLRKLVGPTNIGNLIIEIEGYGKLHIAQDGCKPTQDTPDIRLNCLDAARFLFGCGSPLQVCEIPVNQASWICATFPLPMSWNGQDRV